MWSTATGCDRGDLGGARGKHRGPVAEHLHVVGVEPARLLGRHELAHVHVGDVQHGDNGPAGLGNERARRGGNRELRTAPRRLGWMAAGPSGAGRIGLGQRHITSKEETVVTKTFAALALVAAIAGGVLVPPMTASAAALVIIAPGPPPAVVYERIPPRPGAVWVWVPGHWDWRGYWVWIRGHWARRPRPGAVWVPGYWAPRPGGWIWIEGHWR